MFHFEVQWCPFPVKCRYRPSVSGFRRCRTPMACTRFNTGESMWQIGPVAARYGRLCQLNSTPKFMSITSAKKNLAFPFGTNSLMSRNRLDEFTYMRISVGISKETQTSKVISQLMSFALESIPTRRLRKLLYLASFPLWIAVNR